MSPEPSPACAPIILVTGLGRCGTSLVMQMLNAAGVSCVGTYPDFEVEAVAYALQDDAPGWVRTCGGKAVKVIDPHLGTPPKGPTYRTIWLSRDLQEQARSQLKLIGAASNRHSGRSFVKSLGRDEVRARRALAECGGGSGGFLAMRFEDLLRQPHESAEALARLVGLDPHDLALLDHMAARVVRRSPDCFNGFLEAELVLGGASA